MQANRSSIHTRFIFKVDFSNARISLISAFGKDPISVLSSRNKLKERADV